MQAKYLRSDMVSAIERVIHQEGYEVNEARVDGDDYEVGHAMVVQADDGSILRYELKGWVDGPSGDDNTVITITINQ